MSDTITITINDQQYEARPGQMLIEVADANNVTIPRFCYHKKLSVAANCRMCLVDVEKAPKPMPACATPCNDGMVVRTRSNRAVSAQKATMEFLLINHPLDCPICDQGGECELQDVAMGFGDDVSQYSEEKRVVSDKNIGPLIATDFTRCILCTRCVRFGEEIAGLPELGATGRGELTEIGTYVEHSVSSELSGNVIDLCPVGALTAKPSRYTARPWELLQQASVSPHDCVGSNLYVHTRGHKVIRVVPRDNEAINETWIADRDRFSYTALSSEGRIATPRLRENGKLKDIDWEQALNIAIEKLQAAANQSGNLAGLIHPSSTLEEQYLFQKLLRGLGSNHIDHRLKQVDFSTDTNMPIMPWLGRSIESLEQLDSALLIGANIRREQPILNNRLRKAVVGKGATIASISSLSGQYNFRIDNDLAGSAEQMLHDMAAVVVALAAEASLDLPAGLSELVEGVKAKKEHKSIAQALVKGAQSAIIVGVQAASHPHLGQLMQLAEAIAGMSNSSLGYLSESGNSAGACVAGCLPHRTAAGVAVDQPGRNTSDILANEHRVLLLMGLDPQADIAQDEAKQLASRNDFIIVINSFGNDFVNEKADLVLPLATFLETSGTYVNVEGLWQPFNGCVAPAGQARQGWKILTALAQILLPADDYNYADSSAVRNELKELCRELQLDNFTGVKGGKKLPTRPRGLQRVSETAIYATDEMLRNAKPLQQTQNMLDAGCLRISQAQADKLKLNGAEQVHIKQNEGTAILPLVIDDNVPPGCAWVAAGIKPVAALGNLLGGITVEGV